MEPSIASIHRCVKYLLGRTQKWVRTGVGREEAMKYSLNGIQEKLSEICIKNDISSLTAQELWELYFLKDERLKLVIEKKEIKTIEELMLKVKDYYAENELWY